MFSRGFGLREVYPGTTADIGHITRHYETDIQTQIYCLVDLPFSFVLDTLLLPYDIYAIRREE